MSLDMLPGETAEAYVARAKEAARELRAKRLAGRPKKQAACQQVLIQPWIADMLAEPAWRVRERAAQRQRNGLRLEEKLPC